MIMATEYKLNYTASDINAKLDVIDGTKNYYTTADVDEKLEEKQDVLIYDTEPTDGSDNLLTSGTIYNVIGDINTVIVQINTLIGGVS